MPLYRNSKKMDQKFIEIAKNELREDDLRKTQSLAQFREWISKHPFLSEVRQGIILRFVIEVLVFQFDLLLDDCFLLQFLRAKKYSVDDAFQTFEKCFLAKKRYAQFFDQPEEVMAKALQLLETGYFLPLSGRDSAGRKIVLMRTKKADMDLYDSQDAMRLMVYIVSVLMEEEETQIGGLIFIFDHMDITLRHIMSPIDVKNFMSFVKNCACIRQKGNFVVNLPTFANYMIELFKTGLSEKLKQRVFILKNNDELKALIDPSMLPSEYGGLKTDMEMLEEFKKLAEEKSELTKLSLGAQIDWSKVPVEKIQPGDEVDPVGSFRKLEID